MLAREKGDGFCQTEIVVVLFKEKPIPKANLFPLGSSARHALLSLPGPPAPSLTRSRTLYGFSGISIHRFTLKLFSDFSLNHLLE